MGSATVLTADTLREDDEDRPAALSSHAAAASPQASSGSTPSPWGGMQGWRQGFSGCPG